MKKILLLFLVPVLLCAQNAGGVFSVGPNMNTPRMGQHHVVLDNGDVLLIGGHTTDFISLNTAEYYANNNMFLLLNMNYPHDTPALVKHSNGLYYIFGGSDNLGIAPGYNTVETFNPNGNTFNAVSSTMNYGRMILNGVELTNGKILLVGGWYDNNSATYGEIYDPINNTFSLTGALNFPRASAIIVPTTDGKAYIFGGNGVYGDPYYENVEEYDPATNQFTLISQTLFESPTGLSLFNNYKANGSNKDFNGNYDFYTIETTTGVIHLISFNPTTKVFSKIVLDKAISLQEGYSISAYTLNKQRDKIYLLATKYTAENNNLCLYTVDLRTNTLYEPTGTYVLPTNYIVGSVSMDMLSNGNILVAGGSTSNDFYYNFNPVVNTILIEPSVSIVIPINNEIPKEFKLLQNYPNPFNPSTKISFSLNNTGEVKLKIYDILGNEVAELLNGYLIAGNYEIEFNPMQKGLNLSSGIYVYQLSCNGISISKKMILEK